jgi:hypothetical protein
VSSSTRHDEAVYQRTTGFDVDAWTLGCCSRRPTAVALCAATILLPGGFLLGGAWFYEGDPGIGIALVPLGAVALIWACAALALTPARRAP